MLKKILVTLSLLMTAVSAPALAVDFVRPGDDETPPIAPPPVPETLRVVTFGDSITKGYGATPYSVYLKQMFDAQGCDVAVINEGKSSESTIDGVNRIGKVLGRHKPHYILIMEGANDARIGIGSGTVAANYGSMMDQAIAAGAKPIVSAITPNTEGGSENRSIPESFNPGIAAEAGNRGVPYVDNYNALAGPNWGSYNFDGLHMTNAGQRVLADQFFQALPCGGGGGSGSSGGGGGCFIATAAYGSLLEPHVVLLREFRDTFLLTNEPGKQFVSTYYTYSPPIADYIARHESLKVIIRILLLPLIGIAYLLMHGLWYLIPLGSSAVLLYALHVFSLRRRAQNI